MGTNRQVAWGWRAAGAVALAAVLWTPALHLLFRPALEDYRRTVGVPPAAAALAETHLRTWSDPGLRTRELERMRQRNPEWDFMSRTYFVLALANLALRDPGQADNCCEIIDAILDNTIETEAEHGFEHFLMEYGQVGGWVAQPPGSVFVDGEIALMIAVRRFVRDDRPPYREALRDRIEKIVAQMGRGDVMCAESYPDECWLFCNTVGLAAIRIADILDGADHSAFIGRWIETARQHLVEPRTGILISAFGVDGTPSPSAAGPEGSTIWMAAHMLEVVDPAFAADQYQRARAELGRSFLGFGYAREWPPGLEGRIDVDSGPVIPGFGASASSSGLAILGAAAFDDSDYLRNLLTSLQFAGFPEHRDGCLRYLAGNPVGDAVLLYAMMEGPLWSRVIERSEP